MYFDSGKNLISSQNLRFRKTSTQILNFLWLNTPGNLNRGKNRAQNIWYALFYRVLCPPLLSKYSVGEKRKLSVCNDPSLKINPTYISNPATSIFQTTLYYLPFTKSRSSRVGRIFINYDRSIMWKSNSQVNPIPCRQTLNLERNEVPHRLWLSVLSIKQSTKYAYKQT